MKTKAILMMMLAGVLSACTLEDDEPEEWKPTTETWEVTIEPEYVIDIPYWGGEFSYWGYRAQMEAYNAKGQRLTFSFDQIEGFTFEEGYRYKLLVDATTTDPSIMDGPCRTFKLNKLISKEHVGINMEGCREVTMDVRKVLMLTPNTLSSQGYYFLSGSAVDSYEKIDINMVEIFGANLDWFGCYDDADNYHRYICRMRLSITPSEHASFGTHRHRIRLEELVSQQEVEGDSVVVAATMEEYNSKAKELF